MSRPAAPASSRALLALAAVAVAFAAADTYVVVLALPDMMTTVGLGVDELQRAAPIVSGFLLGYVAVLPLIGRIADLRGRVPVLVGSLVVFAVGSLVTALAFDLPTIVTGRFLQGVGGGGLVPATLALVADLYPSERRAVPLGVVSAVQELGSVIGPLYGALVLAVADWEAIFWINLAAALALAAALRALGGGAANGAGARATSAGERVEPPAPDQQPPPPVVEQRASASERTSVETPARSPRPDVLSALLLLLGGAATVLLLAEPRSLVTDVELGLPFVPLTGDSRWLTPLALVAVGAFVLVVVRGLTARRPLLDLRSWVRTLAAADPVGSALLAVTLGCVILAFATADPAASTFSPAGPYLLVGALVAAVALVVHLRRAANPLVPRGALTRRPAWGSLLVSFFVGAALIAALVEIPVYARLTTYRDSQLDAALVLVRLLVAIPVGAVAGGFLARRVPVGVVTIGGMLLAAAGFADMSRWGESTLESPWVTVPLVLAGLGFGLALAPVNAALLDATESAVHGLASALVVVARMVGMLVGISVLTTIGLRRYYAAYDPDDDLVAALAQSQTIFLGAAVCAVLAGALAVVLFRGAGTSDRGPTGIS